MDAENLPVGEKISDTLLDAIVKAKVAIIVFSENYASSSWCLDELAKIIECKDRRDHVGMKVIPVFYKVEPTFVRYQTGPYGIAMAVYKEKNDPERIKKWCSALNSAANLSGLSTVNYQSEFQLLERIVYEACKAIVSWEEDFKMTQQASRLGNVATAAAKVATGKNVKDERNKVAAAVASPSPKPETGKAGLTYSHGKNVKDTEKTSLAAAVASPKLETGEAGLTCRHGKNVKDTENELLAAAVASPKLESGKAELKCSHALNYGPLVFISTDSSRYLSNSLKDILDSLDHEESFGMVCIYCEDGEIGWPIRRLRGVKLSETINLDRKISAVAELHHENLLRLRVNYFRRDEILLFYDFMRKLRSLYEALHGNADHLRSRRTGMGWEIRLDIALGAARGIESIHSQHMSHGNIKVI